MKDGTAQPHPYGVDVVNDEGMPCVRFSRLSTIRRNQFFRIQRCECWRSEQHETSLA